MVIGGVWETKEGADDVVFRSIRATGMYVDSSRDIRVLGGSYGPSVDNDAGQIRPSCPGCAAPQGILLDGVVFHDATLTPGSDAHVECLQVGEVDGLTIRNSRFNNCETHNVFISPWWGGPERNILLENNFGGNVRTGYYGFRVAAGDASDLCENITFRYNSAETAFLIQCGQAQNVSMIANVGPYVPWACDTRITYIRNVFQGAKCGATDLNAPSDFVDPAANDLHLKPGAPAIGHGYRKSFPKRDIDGRPRPIHKGRMPDAGAAERS
jgi:hypothetical protein